jgi:gas vesicle protein
MNDRVKQAAEHLNREIEHWTRPEDYSKQEAIEILEEVLTEIEALVDALKDEIKDETKSGDE